MSETNSGQAGAETVPEPEGIHPLRILDEFRQRRRDFVRYLGPGMTVTAIAFLIALYFVEPSPPRELVIAAGQKDGQYFATALAYAKVFERNGITLTVRETVGSLENFELLVSDENVDLALVQGGSAPAELLAAGTLESLASVYFEPLWVFHRADLNVSSLADLSGQRIVIGQQGSGSFALASLLLNENGVHDNSDGTTFVLQNETAGVARLKNGDVDVLMFVSSPQSAIVRDLLDNSSVGLMDFSRQMAYERRHSFLRGVTLEEGVIDLEKNLPSRTTRLVAPAAGLVATTSLHQAFVPLLLEAAMDCHHDGGVLADEGELPTVDYATFAINDAARSYLQHGPSFFQRHLSFWVASLLDRTKIMIIPLITFLIPLVKMAPPIYRWRIRSRIYRWYDLLRRIDQNMQSQNDAELEKDRSTIEAMSRELDSVEVPLSYMEEFYNLRLHIHLVEEELQRYMATRSALNVPDSSHC
ncbi:MAG: ABC transporter substrate-binding protein [Planctomycetaceae bacterium]|nr:ABC transporter substrate-binding protein [Planctomycetaceae bacterium]